MRRFLSIFLSPLVLGLFALIALSLMIYFFSGLLIFGGRFASDYERPKEAICNDWYHTEVFKTSPESPVPSCEEALTYPRRNEMLKTEEGLNVRLVIPEQGEAPGLWLHIHGITDSYLSGMRFVKLAKREGLQLMMLELQNHGGSDRHAHGSSWGCREKYDLLAALNYIRQTWPNKPILLSGTSMGTMTITQAVLTRPEAFDAVRGIIYESPLSTLDNIADRMCVGSKNQACSFVFKKLVPFFSSLRTDVDFDSCFRNTQPPTEIPTQLWLSRDEFKTPEQIALASVMPGHKNLSIRIFDHGSHSAYYSYVPKDVEQALHQFWQDVSSSPVH